MAMLPKFAYKFWKVYDRFFDGTKPGLPGAIPATKYFSQISDNYFCYRNLQNGIIF